MKKKKNKILLSICIITKDESKNLKRCLDSLLPLIVEDWCELIVVDTGSSDDSIDVAKKRYAQVYEKTFDPWSFSDARNYAISKAVGKRVFIVDSDEELGRECVDPLKKILLGGRYNQPTFFFQIRNIYSKDNRRYTKFQQPRIFLRKGFRYEGDVHNKPKAKTPYLFFEDLYLNHYGYKWVDDKNLAEKKKNRSLPMLLKEHKKDSHDTHILTHIVKTYKTVKEYDKVLEYGYLWIDEMQKIRENGEFHEGWFSYMEVFLDIIEVYLTKDDVEKAFEIVRTAEQFSKQIPEIYIMIGNHHAEIDAEITAYYYERAIRVIRENQNSAYKELLTTNVEMILPRIFLYLAVYYYQKGERLRSGQYLNDGILLNVYGDNLRWDIYNMDRLKGI